MREWHAHAIRIVIVVGFAAAIRLWLLDHTEVLARDSIDFIRVANRLDNERWPEVLRSSHQPPGYPLIILGMSKLLQPFDNRSPAERFALSAQVASIAAGLLAIVPIYLFGARLSGRNAGFLAALLFQAFPVCVRVTSDGLSEAIYILFIAWGVYFAVRALDRNSFFGFVAVGVCGGLAYLTRPEGLELPLAFGIVAIIAGIRTLSFRQPAFAVACMACGLAPFVGLFVGATGKLTRKPTSEALIRAESASESRMVSGPPLASFWNADSQSMPRQARAAWEVLREATRSAHYYGLALGLVGIWWQRHRIRREPATWLLLALPIVHFIVLWRMASAVRYVSERHTIVIALFAAIWGGALLAQLAGRFRWPTWSIASVALIVALMGLPSALKPMHLNRAGHHAAGIWLADQVSPDQEILDPYAWARYYSGAAFRSGDFEPARARFVVLEQSDNDHSRLGTLPLARNLATRGRCVFRSQTGKNIVEVYRVE